MGKSNFIKTLLEFYDNLSLLINNFKQNSEI